MWHIILKIVILIIIALGIIMIFDARLLSKKFFGFGDQNSASLGMKILGLIIALSGAAAIYLIR